MELRIRRAKKLAESIKVEEIEEDLKKLEMVIEKTWRYMREIGVTEICRRCAEETGSCCRDWVEDEVDEVMIAMNIVMGVKIPKRRLRDDLCYFLGENGCVLKVRPNLCVSYLCELITRKIGYEREKKLQELIEKEIEISSNVREKFLRKFSCSLGRSSLKSYRFPSHIQGKNPST